MMKAIGVNVNGLLAYMIGRINGGKMESTTTTIERGSSQPPAVWPIVLQAFVGALVVGDQVASRWGTWDLFGRFMGITLLVTLVLNPTIEAWRQHSGKDVRFSNLALSGYTLVWIAAVVFNRHSH
jgi:hypothetical protein